MQITEVSKKYGLTQDTLRYYEKIGLIENVPRNGRGVRDYDDNNCSRIEFIKCMREAGMPIDKLCKYFELLGKGKNTAKERMKLLESQKEEMVEQKKKIEDTIKKINYKIGIYKDIVEGKRKDFVE